MASVYQLQILPEDRKACADMTRQLISVYHRKDFTRSNIHKIFEEWKSLARRIKTGEQMIETTAACTTAKTSERAHLQALGDLHFLLTKMLTFYEGFFTSAFPPEDEARYQKTQPMIEEVHRIILA